MPGALGLKHTHPLSIDEGRDIGETGCFYTREYRDNRRLESGRITDRP